MSNIKAGDDIFFTLTMAEVLEKQGLFEDALMVYKILADTNPWDTALKSKIDTLKGLAAKGRGKRATAQRAD